jgi:hypothetical protein
VATAETDHSTPPTPETAELWAKRIRARSRWARRRARLYAGRVTSPWRALPDFIVIGAAKSGTTSTFRYLSGHPLVVPPMIKEIRFFAHHVDRGVGWYRAHFPTRAAIARVGRAAGGTAITGEASPAYLSHPAAPERTARIVPGAKLIAVLRNPVDRAIAAYHYTVKVRAETRSIEQAMADNLRSLDVEHSLQEHDDFESPLRFHNYVSRGHYAEGLARWYRCFDHSQLLVLELDELSRGGGDGFARMLEFLELPRWRPPVFTEHNAGSYPPAPASLRSQLARHYEAHNAALWNLLGVDWGWDSTRGT